jgi:hypothetical protein
VKCGERSEASPHAERRSHLGVLTLLACGDETLDHEGRGGSEKHEKGTFFAPFACFVPFVVQTLSSRSKNPLAASPFSFRQATFKIAVRSRDFQSRYAVEPGATCTCWILTFVKLKHAKACRFACAGAGYTPPHPQPA